jgi:polyhydroxyalkanoate synthase
MNLISWPFESLDRVRRLQGLALDRIGLGRHETPYRIVFSRPGLRLRCYGDEGGGPILFIVPAPIKRPYIWDLSPERSVVSPRDRARLWRLSRRVD